MLTVAKNDITLEDILDYLAREVAARLEGADEAPAKGKGKASKKAEPEPEADEDDDDEELSADVQKRIKALLKKKIGELRKIALGMEFDEEEVAEADKDTLATEIAKAEFEDEDGDDGDEDDEYAEERERLSGLTLPKVKAEAKDWELKPADMKGLDKDGIIDLIIEAQKESEGDEDGDDADDDAEIEDPDDWETETLDEYEAADLKALCDKYEIAYAKNAKKATLIKLLQEN